MYLDNTADIEIDIADLDQHTKNDQTHHLFLAAYEYLDSLDNSSCSFAVTLGLRWHDPDFYECYGWYEIVQYKHPVILINNKAVAPAEHPALAALWDVFKERCNSLDLRDVCNDEY